MDDNLHPIIVDDFPLEQFTESMNIQEKKAFYKGFSKCYTAFLGAIHENEKIFLPSEYPDMIFHFTDLMIEQVQKKEVMS